MVNNWVGIGHIVYEGDDVYGKTSNGVSYYRNRIAVDASYKDKDGQKVSDADFIDFKAFAGTADMLNTYVHKGSKICLTGKLKTRNWESEDKKGREVYILVQHVELLDPKPAEA